MKRSTILSRGCLRLGCGLAASLLLTAGLPAADHRDGPTFGPGIQMPQADLNDLFIFRSPANGNNTVLVMTVSPFAGQAAPDTFDPALRYEIVIDQDRNSTPDLSLSAVFGTPATGGAQTITLSAGRRGRETTTLATGLTGVDIPLPGGGMLRAGKHDDPFFFDAIGFLMFADDGVGTFPRATGATNFFGPNVNTLAIILEVPTAALLKSADRPVIGAWMRTLTSGGKQLDRAGLPFINQFVIPPLPLNNPAQRDRRNAFNHGRPGSDLRGFRADAIATLTGFWGNSPGRAGAVTDRLLLPAVLTFDTSFTFASPNGGFPNGRRLRDDVADFMLNLVSNGAITTDNVADDNGDLITDGSMRPDGSLRPIAFPYLGPPSP